MSSEFFNRIKATYDADQERGRLRGLADTRLLIEQRAMIGFVEVRASTISEDAVETLRGEGFEVTHYTRKEGMEWDPYEIAYYRISWH